MSNSNEIMEELAALDQEMGRYDEEPTPVKKPKKIGDNPIQDRIDQNRDKFDRALISNLKEDEKKEVLRFRTSVDEFEFTVIISISLIDGFEIALDSDFLYHPKYFNQLLDEYDKAAVTWANVNHIDIIYSNRARKIKAAIAYNKMSNYALEILENTIQK